MKSSILITGGAGYLGSTLVPELLHRDYHVTVVDNFMYRQNSLASVCHHPNFSVINGDVRNLGLMAPLFDRADYIIPLAALVGAPLCERNPIDATSINRNAPIEMFKRLRKSQRVIMPITSSAYGAAGGLCTEEAPLHPVSLYARDKIEVEKRLMELENAVSLRLTTVFGMSPRMRIDLLVNDFTYRALVDRSVILYEGHFMRNYVHVKDVARVFCFVLENFDRLKGEIYNVGLPGANLSKKQLCQKIKEFIPQFNYVEASVGEDPDKRDYNICSDKIRSAGFTFDHSLEEGIQELIKGYTMLRNSRYSNI